MKIDSGLDREEFFKKLYPNEWGKITNKILGKSGKDKFNKDKGLICMVACKPQGITAVHVFDIYSENIMRIISYRNS